MDQWTTIGKVFLWEASLQLFPVKVMAVPRFTELLLPKNVTRRRIRVCFCSMAAVAAMAKDTTESALVWES
jgi:hypothetical protein